MNWNLWLGPAPYPPYTPTRPEPMHWRYIRDYSTGILTDWGSHLVDTAQLAVNDPLECPVEVRAWSRPLDETLQSDISATYEVHYRYSNGMTVAVRTSDDERGFEDNASIRLLGSKGWIAVTGWRGRFEASDPALLRRKFAPGESTHWPMPPNEQRNVLDVLKTGAAPTYPGETAPQAQHDAPSRCDRCRSGPTGALGSEGRALHRRSGRGTSSGSPRSG